MRQCVICEADISHRHSTAIVCSDACKWKRNYAVRKKNPEGLEKTRKYMRKYMKEYLKDPERKEKHQAAVRKYQRSEKGKAMIKKSREKTRRKKNERNNR